MLGSMFGCDNKKSTISALLFSIARYNAVLKKKKKIKNIMKY